MFVLWNIKKLYSGASADAAAVRTGVDLVVRAGRIAEITPAGQVAYGADVTTVDASAFVVTPGLVDCHGHITALGLRTADVERMNCSQEALLWVEKILYTTLVEGGVTTLRDVGGATHFMKRMVDEGVMLGPRLKVAICMLSSTGGHADFRGTDRCHAELSRLWPEAPGRPSSIVDGSDACRKRVREIAACGADLIKLCTSPGVASPSDALEHRDFTAEEIAVICDEAKARGLKVAAHAHSQLGIGLAIDNGVDDIQHISFMDERLVERAARRGCTVTPTSWIIAALLETGGLDPFVMDKAKRAAEHHYRAVALARAGGLAILAGTDPVLPNMHGQNYMEMVHLVRDGLSPLQAWYGATGLAAQEIGQTDTGVLEVGRRADLLITTADVVADPAAFARGALLEVVKDGIAYRGGVAALPQRSYRSATVERMGDRS
jgi:imidazolonepropionase-like amidohydrolase